MYIYESSLILIDCYICAVCKKVFLVNTKQSVVTIVINGFTTNVITWMTLIMTF